MYAVCEEALPQCFRTMPKSDIVECIASHHALTGEGNWLYHSDSKGLLDSL